MEFGTPNEKITKGKPKSSSVHNPLAHSDNWEKVLELKIKKDGF